MLPDPLTVSYDGVSHALPRSVRSRTSSIRSVSNSSFATPDGEFVCYTQRTIFVNGETRTEITLERTAPDPNGPFVGVDHAFPNRVGISFETNRLREGASTDIPKLRAAILALVTPVLQDRLINGEI